MGILIPLQLLISYKNHSRDNIRIILLYFKNAKNGLRVDLAFSTGVRATTR